MIAIIRADDNDQTEWDKFVENSEGAEIYHLYNWRNVFERTFNHNCYYLLARDNEGATCGVLPLVHLKSRLFGSFLVSIPCFNYCGVLAVDGSVRLALVEYVRDLAIELNASHVELRHRDNINLDLPKRDEKVAMRLLLPDSEKELWAQLSTKMRTRIRRPSKEGALCVEGGIELVDEFYTVFSRNMRDLGTPVYPKKLFEEVCNTFSEAARIYVVRLNETPVAAGFTLSYGSEMEIPWASALRDFNRYAVNMLLYWSILRSAISHGHKTFDFGRSTSDSGTYQFKKQWGAMPQQLQWHYLLRDGVDIPELNPQNPKFRLATKVWQRLPLGIANALGPRIVRNLP